MNIFMLISFGLLGGIIRCIVGMFKHKVFSGKTKFNSQKFWTGIAVSSMIGVFCALLTVEDYRIILLAGYAGTDMIQALVKVSR